MDFTGKMSYKQQFHTGETIHYLLGNLKVHQLRKICKEATAYMTEQNKSRDKLYNIIATAPNDCQDTIREVALRALQERSVEVCTAAWISKRKFEDGEEASQRFKKKKIEERRTWSCLLVTEYKR